MYSEREVEIKQVGNGRSKSALLRLRLQNRNSFECAQAYLLRKQLSLISQFRKKTKRAPLRLEKSFSLKNIIFQIP